MTLNKVKMAEGVYYVGAVDWNLRDFHGYRTPRGVTYNSYLIVDEKICLVDNVKAPFADELIERISQIVDPAKIDYVVTNHIEPDHSGSLPAVMRLIPQAKVFITGQGKDGVLKYYQQNYNFEVVKEGDVLPLGRGKLHFVPLPMLHWPDSMASYLDSEQILFSNDAFGQHICTSKRFDDENDLSEIIHEAATYYANILMPFGKLIIKALAKLKDLPIKIIAPSHGVSWRSHIPAIIEKYGQWGAGYTTDKVVIAYDSMWGSTDRIARRLLEGVAAAGVTGKLFKLSAAELSDIAYEILEARGVLIGSSTHYNVPLDTVGGLLTYLKGLRPVNKLGAAFGAYGWGGGAQTVIEDGLKAIGFKVEQPGVALRWTPDQAEIEKCFNFGLEFGKLVAKG